LPPTRTRPKLTLHSQSVPAQLGQLESLCQLVDLGARSAGFDDRTSYACQLAVTEACENIILHGYRRQPSGDIRVTTRSRPGDLIIDIVDSAPPFNPTQVPSDEAWPLSDPPVGGRGLLIIRRVMDEVHYRRRSNRNMLRMRKRARTASL
jgi:serine/threonine-protein kinase RsbW